MVWFEALAELGQFQMSAKPHVSWQLLKLTVPLPVPCHWPNSVPAGSGWAGAEQDPPLPWPAGAVEAAWVGSEGEAVVVARCCPGPVAPPLEQPARTSPTHSALRANPTLGRALAAVPTPTRRM